MAPYFDPSTKRSQCVETLRVFVLSFVVIVRICTYTFRLAAFLKSLRRFFFFLFSSFQIFWFWSCCLFVLIFPVLLVLFCSRARYADISLT